MGYMADPVKAICSDAHPTLKQAIALGHLEEVKEILTALVKKLEDFTAARYKFNAYQRNSIAMLWLTQYPYLRIPAFHIFIGLCMGGEFGKFYNTLDPMDITTAFRRSFQDYIKTARAKWEQRTPR